MVKFKLPYVSKPSPKLKKTSDSGIMQMNKETCNSSFVINCNDLNISE